MLGMDLIVQWKKFTYFSSLCKYNCWYSFSNTHHHSHTQPIPCHSKLVITQEKCDPPVFPQVWIDLQMHLLFTNASEYWYILEWVLNNWKRGRICFIPQAGERWKLTCVQWLGCHFVVVTLVAGTGDFHQSFWLKIWITLKIDQVCRL